jgi:S-adenosylmethionine synthetase
LYGAADQNSESAVNVLVDSVKKAQEPNATVSMEDWAKRYPTNTEDCGRVIKDIAEKYLSTDTESLPRVLQFSSEDCYTKYELCQLFAEILGLPLEGMVANKQGNDPHSNTQRPYDTHLSTKALKDLGIPIWTQDFLGWW